MADLVSIENVDMRYGGAAGTLAVSGLSLKVGKGEFAGGMSGFRQLAVTFPDLKAREIAKWIVETRRRAKETRTFKNVSLHPGKLTKVEIAAEQELGDESKRTR